MESQSLKLSLNLSPPWLLAGEQKNNDSELLDYIAKLEHELRKIESFKRELPLSVLLLTNAIEKLKEEIGKSEGEEIKVKEACDLNESPRDGSEVTVSVDGDKKTWMQSAQLWSSDQASFINQKRTREEDEEDKFCKYTDKVGALSSFTEGSEISPVRDFNRTKPVPSATELSLQVPSEPVACLKIGSGATGRNMYLPVLSDPFKMRYQATPTTSLSSALQGPKKQRRCWSPELHRRFIDALEKLGGSQVATPKQIREHMQVNGLTNDEVKSHLQKYRLHIRKLPNSKDKLFSSHDLDLASSSGGGSGRTIASKTETSNSDSPQGPLHMAIRSAKCNSAASRCRSNDEEDEEKSDSHSWGGI